MRKFDSKSLILGAMVTLSIIALTSATSDDTAKFEFVASPVGIAIYNGQTNTLYSYKMWAAKINTTPFQVFKVAEDGSSLAEIK